MFYIVRNGNEIFRCAPLEGALTAQDLGLRGERTLEVVADDAPEVVAHLKALADAEAEQQAAAAEAERLAEEAAREEAKRTEAAAALAEEAARAREEAAATLEAAAATVQAALEKGDLTGPKVAEAYAAIALAGVARLRG